ncbi:MAG: C10 family peptidase [Gemmatimonadota bacterium]|nr:MAG: C10 family peptidase [Gemmatimonadota bacterium]
MKSRRHYLIAIVVAVALLILLDPAANQLQDPNRIDLEGEHRFLLQTTWHQVGGYARFMTQDDDAGCWATAIAQIAHHHRLTPRGNIEYQTSGGHQVSVDLDDYEFDHDRFVSRLDDETPVVSSDQVAKYIYFIAAVLYTDFGAHGYLEHETFVDRLQHHLNVSVEFHEYDKESFLSERTEIQSLVRREIGWSRPIMLYFDNGKDFGHAVVVDGYTEVDETFLVHLNMGWGGRHDGWYDLFRRIIGVRDDMQTRFLITIKPD